MNTATERTQNGRDRVRTIDAELLLQYVRSGRPVTILDVRSTAEFRGPAGRIPGARSVPMDELVARSGELLSRRAETLVVVSEDGVRSRMAALELELVGFTEVRSLEGGMRRWSRLGFPIERGPVPPSRPR